MEDSANFRKSIRQRGYRVTPQRELVLDALRASRGHCTAEEIYLRVAKRAPSLNRATVYRSLEFLNKVQLITSADLGTGSRVYELTAQEPHHHLVCTQCGAVEQVAHTRVAALFKAIERDHDFKVTTDHLALFGVCGHCRTESV